MLDYSSFSALYDRYQESGLKVRDFCHNEGIHETTFYYWVRKCKKRQILSSGDFVPMVIGNAPASPIPSDSTLEGSSSAQSITCEITLPSGARIKLNGALSSDSLRVLLHTLSR